MVVKVGIIVVVAAHGVDGALADGLDDIEPIRGMGGDSVEGLVGIVEQALVDQVLLRTLIVQIHILPYVVAAHHRGELILKEIAELIYAADGFSLGFVKDRPRVVEGFLARVLILAVLGVGVEHGSLVFDIQLIGGQIVDQRSRRVADRRGHVVIHLVFADETRHKIVVRVVEIGFRVIVAVAPALRGGQVVRKLIVVVIRRDLLQIVVQVDLEVDIRSALRPADRHGVVECLNAAVRGRQIEVIVAQLALCDRGILNVGEILLQRGVQRVKGVDNAAVVVAEITDLIVVLGIFVFRDLLAQLGDH